MFLVVDDQVRLVIDAPIDLDVFIQLVNVVSQGGCDGGVGGGLVVL